MQYFFYEFLTKFNIPQECKTKNLASSARENIVQKNIAGSMVRKGS